MKLVDDLIAAHRALRECDTVGGLFARAAGLATEVCGFERGVIASVVDGHLMSLGSEPLADDRSDALRRLLLAAAVPLTPGTEESELVRRAGRSSTRRAPSRLAQFLGLESWALSPIAPESAVLALIVLDRAGPAVSDDEQAILDAFALTVGLSVEHFVLRRRAADLAEEVRLFAGSSQALAREVLDAPVALPLDHGFGPALPRPETAGPAGERTLLATLSARERRIAELLVEGRSNREIAEVLVVSPETIKTHVGRILRKLGAVNRVEAVSRLLRVPS